MFAVCSFLFAVGYRVNYWCVSQLQTENCKLRTSVKKLCIKIHQERFVRGAGEGGV